MRTHLSVCSNQNPLNPDGHIIKDGESCICETHRGTDALIRISDIRRFLAQYRKDADRLDTLFEMLKRSKEYGGVIVVSVCDIQDGQITIPVTPAEMEPKVQALIDDLIPKVSKGRTVVDQLNRVLEKLA